MVVSPAMVELLMLTLLPFIDAPSLTLRESPNQGMHVHLAKSKRDKKKLDNSPHFVAISESGSSKSYFYEVCSICLFLAQTTKVEWPHNRNGLDLVETLL